ncbi:hypothetical protein DKX38_025696 [Salix brachista]|uniref:Enoyl reductase (ER) domain-containing protein n=1 Tax=Salix brachista TaxID=2182728 RepID=A0A5N5K2H8_9ROSI|nr:hypothetical protein DKX38_025696 [Salix brachista]
MAGKLMHALQYDSYGGGAAGLKHVEVPVPSAKKDEVLIKLEATSLNPYDMKIQNGVARPFLPRSFPYIPSNSSILLIQTLFCTFHFLIPNFSDDLIYINKIYVATGIDIAGEVVAVGPGVENFKTGDKVVAVLSASVSAHSMLWSNLLALDIFLEVIPVKHNAFDVYGARGVRTWDLAHAINLVAMKSAFLHLAILCSGGGLAEFAVAKKSLSVARPPEISAAEAAGLPIAGLTAYEALTQFAGVKLDGSGNQKNILITAASGGVEGSALKSPSGKKYDAVIHCARAPETPWSTLEPNLSENGKVIHISPSPGVMITFAVKKLTFSKKQLIPLILTPNGEKLKHLVNLAKEGKLKTVIDSKYPLSNAEDAWAKGIDGHATGKIIVEP